MTEWFLDREGFVTAYMVSGPKVSPFFSEERDNNQLRYEAHLRDIVPQHPKLTNTESISMKENSRLGLPWRFVGGKDCAFVNCSDFYSTMQRVAFDVATALIVPADFDVQAVLWSYAAVDVYCNGIRIGGLEHAVYKPIGRAKICLPLKAGKNVIYFACETLGVRDTRSVVGLQIITGKDKILVTLPDEEMTKEAAPGLEFLESAVLEENELVFPYPAPKNTQWAAVRHDPDYAKHHLPLVYHPADGKTRIPLPMGEGYITLQTHYGADQCVLRKVFERTEQIKPQKLDPVPSYEENLQKIYRRIADVESLDRGEFGFPISNILARKYLGDTSKDDDRLLMEMLDLIEQRVDCADFQVCGLIRYLKNYPVSKEISDRIRCVLTHFRYWMDMDGFDGMCFWSENHCLMFYASAMQAGEMYPDDDFPLARMTGRELHAWGRGKVLEWLDDVEKNGFEEFLSTVYMCVTFAALINVVDYAEEAISVRAAKITDQLLEMLAMHTFKGGITAPQGRVYRGVLYPFSAGAMAFMNLADPGQPFDFGEGWLGFYATSKYQFPKNLKKLMESEASTNYVTGNARIVLEKHQDWCLTSVQSPREPFTRWENGVRKPDTDPSSHAFVKSYNECFHGTTHFQPGVYGYQQHLWYAALDGEAAVFINHPGSTSESGDMRPGYWHGNGVFPALKQEGPLLGMIYQIPENHPLHYIHLYCPECRFDEVEKAGDWLLLRKGKGYIGLWSSVEMEPWNGMNFHCERRMYGDHIACLCLCAGAEMDSMNAFRQLALRLNPSFDVQKGVLKAKNYTLTWHPGMDDTQYL